MIGRISDGTSRFGCGVMADEGGGSVPGGGVRRTPGLEVWNARDVGGRVISTSVGRGEGGGR